MQDYTLRASKFRNIIDTGHTHDKLIHTLYLHCNPLDSKQKTQRNPRLRYERKPSMHNSKPKNPASIHLQLSGESVIPKYAETHRITFLGADHPQVIDCNMRIRTPLTNCTVTLSFLTENKKNRRTHRNGSATADSGKIQKQPNNARSLSDTRPLAS